MRYLIYLIWFSLPVMCSAAATYTALSCNLADVNAIVTGTAGGLGGPTHVAMDGDIIQIPAGSCTWAGQLTVPNNIGITITGTGTPNSTPDTTQASPSCTATAITFNLSTTYGMIVMTPTLGNTTTRISCMQITSFGTGSAVSNVPMLAIGGTCTVVGCPDLRVDNLTVPSGSNCLIKGAAVMAIANVFGVADHNTIGDIKPPQCIGTTFVQNNHSIWQGMGAFGDYSWIQPTTFGTNQAFFLENNLFSWAQGTDQEFSPNSPGNYYTNLGGGRVVCRFNTWTNTTTGGPCTNHGTETGSRMRGGRQMEAYGNQVACTVGTTGCLAFNTRSGVSRIFGNTYSVSNGGFFGNRMSINTQRNYRPVPFGLCNGTNVYDINDGANLNVWTGTIQSVGAGTITVADNSWTAGAFNFTAATVTPVGSAKYYTVFDVTTGQMAGIASNTASTLTTSWKLFSITGGSGFSGAGVDFTANDIITITSSTLYDAGTHTGSTGTGTNPVTILTDSGNGSTIPSKNWATNFWVSSGAPGAGGTGHAFNVISINTGESFQILSNTSNTITWRIAPFRAGSTNQFTWVNGAPYAITSATQCLDQPAISGGADFGGMLFPGIRPNTQTLDPVYVWNNTGITATELNTDNMNQIANRDYYVTSASFNGTSGVGSGTLANRPSACSPQVGYWATDQGNWNQSGNSFGQGQLYTCSAINTGSCTAVGTNFWCLRYVPFTYPHLLITSPPPTPPTITSPPTLPSAVVNMAYSFLFMASGTAPITFGATGLPSWATFTTGGLLSGTPTASGTSTINVTASNSAGMATSAFTLVVSPISVTIHYTGIVTQ